MTVQNSFQQVMLSGCCDPTEPHSLLVDAVMDGFRVVRECGQWVIPQSQVFEPAVLFEAKSVAGLTPLPSNLEEFVPFRPDVEPCDVSSMVNAIGHREERAAIATAGLLVSLSRFRTAARVLAAVGPEVAGRERFERLWLEFIISNRCESGRDSDQLFAQMLSLADEGAVPDGRLLDICSQGVVWFLKRREVSEATVRRLLEHGRRLVSGPLESDWAGNSAWYRAVAMIPAQRRNARRTRQYMDQAKGSAERALKLNATPANANLLKTYLESSMKEALYVDRDATRFDQLAAELIALDPTWSISYAEAAEGYEVFGHQAKARNMYAIAVEKGPPYVWRHAFELLRLCSMARDWTGAEQAFEKLIADSAPLEILESTVEQFSESTSTPLLTTVQNRLRSLPDGESRKQTG